ncbi:hypothetical protein G3R49_01180 [Shewanella sp. WXL01]|uniref:Uncharacterized protein n=1 Tax=Shewanella maritima TaxID=2520507 RepID=A0A411PGL0_9GAMM|nr:MULTISPECIES: hypothetical protein [Shewanella]NKF49189.1 hypothetical protein [Shewanella sp. WXL01]QBF82693.1 hypothetical protein EXU30_08325 [Shewanella maritima]
MMQLIRPFAGVALVGAAAISIATLTACSASSDQQAVAPQASSQQSATVQQNTTAADKMVRKKPQPTPALVAKATDKGHLELSQAIASLLEIESVRIAKSAFTQSHQITLEHAAHKDANGNPIMGRVMSKPEQFSLFIEFGQCVVRRDSNLKTVVLKQTQCKFQ